MFFFHFLPTCPNCHEPYVGITGLERIDEYRMKCLNCDCSFYYRLDLLRPEFEKITREIQRNEGPAITEHLSKIPLLWEVRPNTLEEEYTKWINQLNPPNHILVTWPWDVVKFIPILAMEYLRADKNRRMIVIDTPTTENSAKDYTGPQSIYESFRGWVFFDTPISEEFFTEEVRSEMKKFKKNSLIELATITESEIRKIGYRPRTKTNCAESFVKCKHKIMKDLESVYGENYGKYIRYYDEIRIGKKRKKSLLNSEGIIDVKLTEMKINRWKVQYDPRWLWDSILLSPEMNDPKKLATCNMVKAPFPDFPDRKTRLTFISGTEEPEKMFDFIERVSPDLLVVPNSDDLMRDIIIRGPKSRSLIRYLKRNETSAVLMFSTNKEVRHLYPYGTRAEDGCNIIPHTCDNDFVLRYFKKKGQVYDSQYPNPLSSRWQELPVLKKESSDTEFKRLEVLDRLDGARMVSEHLQNNALKNDVIKFIDQLQKSPLRLKGPYNRVEIFRRPGNSISSLSYESVTEALRERIDRDDFKRFEEIFLSVYGTENDGISPLMDRMAQIIKDVASSEKIYITLVVNGFDIAGVRQLLTNYKLEEHILSKLIVCRWKDLTSLQEQIPKDMIHIVIATNYPDIDYSVYNSAVNEFIFIGSTKNIEKIDNVIRNRITEFWSRPAYSLTDREPGPEFLKIALEGVDTSSVKEVQEEIENATFELGGVATDSATSQPSPRYERYSRIKAGDEAILLVDKDERGMFITMNEVVTTREGESIAEKEVKSINKADIHRELYGSEVLIDAQGLHRSFKSMFLKYMVKYGKNVSFRKAIYEWNGFLDLYNSSTEWTTSLRKAIGRYNEINSTDITKGEDFLSDFLSRLDLNASDPSYIKRWWGDYEIANVDGTDYHIYNTEHPRSLEDVKKIYLGINNTISGLKLDVEEGEKSYSASILLQEFRRSLLKSRIINSKFRTLQIHVKKEITKEVSESSFFKVTDAFVVKLVKDVQRLKVMSDYNDFIDNAAKSDNHKTSD